MLRVAASTGSTACAPFRAIVRHQPHDADGADRNAVVIEHRRGRMRSPPAIMDSWRYPRSRASSRPGSVRRLGTGATKDAVPRLRRKRRSGASLEEGQEARGQ